MSKGNQVTNKMNVHLYVFGSLMLNRVGRHVNRADIVSINNSALESRRRSSRSRFLSQQVSTTAFATPRYSASALERETTFCRLEDHEIRLYPRKTQYQDVDRRDEGQPPQSASEYAISLSMEDA